jgi:hypothetical protein
VTFIKGQSEILRVVEIDGNKGMKLTISKTLKGMDVVIPKSRTDLDCVALETSQEFTMEGNIFGS